MSPPAPLAKRLGAEMLATYALVAAGCGAIVVDSSTGALGHLGVALAFGLVILVMIAATGHISGAHINPAVTVAFALCRHFPVREVPLYLAAQLLGGTLGAATLRLLDVGGVKEAVTLPAAGEMQALGCELLLTASLMFVITAVATDTRAVGELAAITIGATVAVNALWGGPISGASMNPARSLGPALVSGTWDSHWVYWVGPIVGAVLGALAYEAIRWRAAGEPEERDAEIG